MRTRSEKNRKDTFVFLLFGGILVFAVGLAFVFIFAPNMPVRLKQGWRTLTHESKRILGWEKSPVAPEEKRIREEIILKKMEEASAREDWRALAPEYPRTKKIDSPNPGEKLRIVKNSQEFKEMDRELKDYLKKKEDLFYPEAPLPSPKDMTDVSFQKDKGTEKVVGRLMKSVDGDAQEKPLEENLRLGIRGALVRRKILEKPVLPQVKLKMEAEIELTLWVLPNGTVDRVVPSVKGDAELERVAVQYLKQWRFAPLQKDQPQVEQSGTIPIKFKLQ